MQRRSYKGKNNPNYGKKLSGEAKKRISNANKGRTAWNKGKTHSDETKRKMAVIAKKRGFGGIVSEKHKENISKALKGKKKSPEHVKNMSLSQIGHKAWNKGLDKSDHRVAKYGKSISKSRKGKFCGEEHWNWQGGVTNDPYPDDWNKIRNKRRRKDKYVCQMCGLSNEECRKKYKRRLSIHHIDYDKMNCEMDNLITLCNKCHGKTHYNHDKWIKYFKSKRREDGKFD